jgi:uncharacterized protein (TIGR02231 family)
MKTFFIPLSLLLHAFLSLAGNEKTVSSTITGATVYFNNALVTRNAEVSVNAGITTLVFEHVSPQVIDKTMQVKAGGNFMIIDVKHEVRYPEPKQEPEKKLTANLQLRIHAMEDSVFIRNLDLVRLKARRSNLEKESDIISKNKLFTGAGRSDTMPVLKEMMTWYRNKMEEIAEELLKVQLEERKAGQQLVRVQTKLNELKNFESQSEDGDTEKEPNHCIVVTVSADQPASGNMTVSYLVDGAGWEPAYDLRSGNSKKQMTITYKANVYQNTGENWENVKLKLSTYVNSPSQNEKPVLPGWVLDYFQVKQLANWNLSVNTLSNTSLPTSTESELPQQQPMTPVTDISGFFNTTEFDIKLARTIKSDGNKVLMVIQNKEVPVDYTFCLVPKLNRNAFLVARLPGGSELDLLPAVSNIYVDDTYMGEASVSGNTVSDTLEFSMGKDEDIICGRKKIKDMEKKNLLSKTNLRTITIELVVKNNKSHEVNVDLEDQVPVSSNKTILINVVDKNGAEHDTATGSLKWNLNLQPKQSKKITFTYTIEYDKDKKI